MTLDPARSHARNRYSVNVLLATYKAYTRGDRRRDCRGDRRRDCRSDRPGNRRRDNRHDDRLVYTLQAIVAATNACLIEQSTGDCRRHDRL